MPKTKTIKPKKIIKKEKPEDLGEKELNVHEVTADVPAAETEEEADKNANKYFQGIGRRKTSVASVRLFTQGDKVFSVNDKPFKNYFPTPSLQEIALASINRMKSLDKFRGVIRVKGGGIHSQAEAVRHGISRALVLFNIDFKKRLSKAGYLTRDPRMRERKKFGLKRARRAPQFSKR